ncbi:hypothetical protein FQA39_LY11748 [Lamprigera yunnana]|nr:hypothetical protein FQA39_LY11748 [Lamprigera yunnana]
MWDEALRQCLKVLWENCINHSENLIKNWHKREKVLDTFDTLWKPRQIGSKTLTFEMIEEKKSLMIEDTCGNKVYLGWESVSEVWSSESVLSYR